MTGGPYTRVPCAHEGCRNIIRRGGPSGLCIHHYNEARAANVRRCGDCGAVLRGRGNPTHCQPCRNVRAARPCSDCGQMHLGRFRKSGRCNVCQRKSISIRARIGDDNLRDYYLLRARGMERDQAIAHIEAGLPVDRKIGGKVAKITTMKVVQMVGEALSITPDEILSESRYSGAVDCRAVVSVVMVDQGLSLAQIGRRLNRDHTSIMHLRRTFPKRVAKRPVLAKIVESILQVAA